MSKKQLHAKIAVNTETPEHTYVEKIHTPRKHQNVRCETEEEWLADKHAHIDSAAPSPHGLVKRVPTPVSHTPVDTFPESPKNAAAQGGGAAGGALAAAQAKRSGSDGVFFSLLALGGVALYFLHRH